MGNVGTIGIIDIVGTVGNSYILFIRLFKVEYHCLHALAYPHQTSLSALRLESIHI